MAALSFGLKLRIPSRMNAALSRVIMRLASPTSVLALPARPLGVLLGKHRRRDHLATPALAAQPAEKATLQKLRVEPIGLRPAVFARHRDTRCMNDVDLDGECGEALWQSEAVVSGLERDGDACDLVTRHCRLPTLAELG